MSQYINVTALLQILVVGLLLGAGLPTVFALAVRVNAAGTGATGTDGGAVHEKNPMLVGLSWVIFAAVLIVVLIAVLFIARDFLGHQTGIYLLGAKPK